MSALLSPAVAWLPLPRVQDLGDERRDGTLCVWCGGRPSHGIGPRIGVVHGVLTQFFPRGCELCIVREAARVARIHSRACRRCAPGWECPDSRILYALAHKGVTP